MRLFAFFIACAAAVAQECLINEIRSVVVRGQYTLVVFKKCDREHVGVYVDGAFIAEYKAPGLNGDSNDALDMAIISPTSPHWFFVSPFHSVVFCYHPAIGVVYSSLAQGLGANIKVRGSWYEDNVGWYDGRPRMNSAVRGSLWDENRAYRDEYLPTV